MNLDEVYEAILPYLSDPKAIKAFLEALKDTDKGEVMQKVGKKMEESSGSLKTDCRILLNALEKIIG